MRLWKARLRCLPAAAACPDPWRGPGGPGPGRTWGRKDSLRSAPSRHSPLEPQERTQEALVSLQVGQRFECWNLTTRSAGAIPEVELLQATSFITNYRHKQKFSPSTEGFCNYLLFQCWISNALCELLAIISVKVGPQNHLMLLSFTGCSRSKFVVVVTSYKWMNQNVNMMVRTSVEHGSSADFAPVAPSCQQRVVGDHRCIVTPPSCTAFRAPQSVHLRRHTHTHTLPSGRWSQLGPDREIIMTSQHLKNLEHGYLSPMFLRCL